MQLPTLQDLTTFIDAEKNLFVSLIMIACGFYVTLHPTTDPTVGSLWVGAAMTAAGIYIGHRIEKGNNGGNGT